MPDSPTQKQGLLHVAAAQISIALRHLVGAIHETPVHQSAHFTCVNGLSQKVRGRFVNRPYNTIVCWNDLYVEVGTHDDPFYNVAFLRNTEKRNT